MSGAVGSGAEHASSQWSDDPELAAYLLEQMAGWTDSIVDGTPDELAPVLHDRFLYVSVFGKVYDKASYLDLARTIVGGAFWKFHHGAVRRRADVAQFYGEYFTHSTTTAGDDLTAHTRFTATWVLEGGRWLCLTQHGTFYEPDPQSAAELDELQGSLRLPSER